MAHNLNTKADGTAGFYSLRESAWHGLGTVVNAPLADPRVLEVAGLDWTVRKESLYTSGMATVPDHRAIVRTDTNTALGVVGADYGIVQNADMLAFFRDLAGEHLTVETAGALGQGEKVWALASIPNLHAAIGKDESKGYLLISNDHTGRGKLLIVPTVVRVVCQNTLRMAVGSGNQRRASLAEGYAIRHTSGVQVAMASVAAAYRNTLADWTATQEAMRALAAKRSTATSLRTIIHAAWEVDRSQDEAARAKAIRDNREAAISRIRASATCNVDGTAGSVWADLNAVTEYIDHESGNDAARRFASANFGGAGDDAKARAWDAALALV